MADESEGQVNARLFAERMEANSKINTGLFSPLPSSNFTVGSNAWTGATWREAGDLQRNQLSDTSRAPAGSSGPGGIVALEGGILSCVILDYYWPQYLSLYSSFPQVNEFWEYGFAAGLVLLSVILYVRFCRTAKWFAWGSFIIIGRVLAVWSIPWGLNWRTCIAGFLLVVMFFDRRALLRAGHQ